MLQDENVRGESPSTEGAGSATEQPPAESVRVDNAEAGATAQSPGTDLSDLTLDRPSGDVRTAPTDDCRRDPPPLPPMPAPQPPKRFSGLLWPVILVGFVLALLSALGLIHLRSNVSGNSNKIQALEQRMDEMPVLTAPDDSTRLAKTVLLVDSITTRLDQIEESWRQKLFNQAVTFSSKVWLTAIQGLYRLSDRRVSTIDWATQGLIGELITTYTEEEDTSSPKREETIQSIMTTFGFTDPETLRVASESDRSDSLSVFRPFSYDDVVGCMQPRMVDHLMRAFELDYENLQLLYLLERGENSSLPDDFREFLIKFITRALRESHHIDYGARLCLDPWDNDVYFVKDEYEGWSRTKKLFFRMGEDNATKVRRILTLLQERLENQ